LCLCTTLQLSSWTHHSLIFQPSDLVWKLSFIPWLCIVHPPQGWKLYKYRILQQIRIWFCMSENFHLVKTNYLVKMFSWFINFLKKHLGYPQGLVPLFKQFFLGLCSGGKTNWFWPKNSAKRRAPDLEDQVSS
jgi:hypothetical protein